MFKFAKSVKLYWGSVAFLDSKRQKNYTLPHETDDDTIILSKKFSYDMTCVWLNKIFASTPTTFLQETFRKLELLKNLSIL